MKYNLEKENQNVPTQVNHYFSPGGLPEYLHFSLDRWPVVSVSYSEK
jgi:hypothetical protein